MRVQPFISSSTRQDRRDKSSGDLDMHPKRPPPECVPIDPQTMHLQKAMFEEGTLPPEPARKLSFEQPLHTGEQSTAGD
eukprot:1123881-Prorocentrum_lima.AAC.1